MGAPFFENGKIETVFRPRETADMARALMIRGAGSDVGKSLIVAGLARAATRRGHRVLPFKPQNMSNNAAVTADGGEIGRAQALQALAAGVPAHSDMNPVLLKPETDIGAQIIVQGRRVVTLRARLYRDEAIADSEIISIVYLIK